MYPTISTEGSDSFDAISRSYSYIYQAPWQYAWYCFVALLYGAVVIFFVGLMGSLMVYMGKWGVAQAPGFSERDTQYLYMYAPTSFGWRDLLLHKAPSVETVEVIRNSGQVGETYTLNQNFTKNLALWNYVGAFLVTVWLYLLFLLVVGFGYSFFWSAATIIYFLMRRNVDDTELDEVHLEQTEPEVPYPTTPPANAAPPAPSTAVEPASAKTGMQLVEPPTLRAPTTAPPSTARPTQLAPPGPEAPASGLSGTPGPSPAAPSTDKETPAGKEPTKSDGAKASDGSAEAEGKKP
jgi:hypothetical protein